MTWTGPLRDARAPIAAALGQLLSCPEVFRPFVIVETVRFHQFVQFAGSTERGLLFDVPALSIEASHNPVSDPEAGATIAVDTLRAMGVLDTVTVRVRFESTRSGPQHKPGAA